ncbi:MAG: hypothetical protein AB1488_07645 [Nitrospirota bacterium]
MKRYIVVIIALVFVAVSVFVFLRINATSQPSSSSSKHVVTTTMQQLPEIQQIKPVKPVKIKLKRGAKDDYTWEISGEDVDEILKVDKRLRKGLRME